MPSQHGRRPRIRLVVATVTAVLPLTACSEAGDPPIEDPAPIETGGPEVFGGVPAPETSVNEDVRLVDIEIAYPADGVHEEGEDASLLFALTNTGTEPITLTDVTGPGFADATTTGPGDGTGFEPIEVGPDDNVYVGAEGPPSVTLVDLQESLRSSQSTPVTFVFEEAEEVTVEVPVAAEPNEEDPASGTASPTG